MQFLDHSQLNLTQSCMSSNAFQEQSSLLESRLSKVDMQEMGMSNLQQKLLQLYEALDNTQKDNQLLRIQKAQLRTLLKNCKARAEQFIQTNLMAPKKTQRNIRYPLKQRVGYYTPAESIQNCFMTPYQSQQQLDDRQNKVFVKSHKRGVSTNCMQSKPQERQERRCYNSSLNSPVKNQSVRSSHSNNHKQKPYNKISIPKDKLNNLIFMERQHDQRQQLEHYQHQNLQNFQSFYCHQKLNQNQTLRRSESSKKVSVFAKKDSTTNRLQANLNYDCADFSQRTMNKSTSSSNFYTQKELAQKGFKIPSSIQQIWGTSAVSTPNVLQRVGYTNNKVSKLSKVNIMKAVQFQKKSYLNS